MNPVRSVHATSRKNVFGLVRDTRFVARFEIERLGAWKEQKNIGDAARRAFER